jgi:hypothetical protein
LGGGLSHDHHGKPAPTRLRPDAGGGRGGLIFFHTARIFDPLDFYAKDQPPNLPLTLFVFFAGLWGMPLLFVVSGLGAWYSLRSRTATGFVREWLARLLVPFLVGLLVVVPPQVYYQLRFQQQDPSSYWEFYGDFFQVHLGLKFPWFVRPDDPPDLFELAHLWFLYFLLVYSLLLLPALLSCVAAGGSCWSGWPPSAPGPGRSFCSPCPSPSLRRPSAPRSPGVLPCSADVGWAGRPPRQADACLALAAAVLAGGGAAGRLPPSSTRSDRCGPASTAPSWPIWPVTPWRRSSRRLSVASSGRGPPRTCRFRSCATADCPYGENHLTGTATFFGLAHAGSL